MYINIWYRISLFFIFLVVFTPATNAEVFADVPAVVEPVTASSAAVGPKASVEQENVASSAKISDSSESSTVSPSSVKNEQKEKEAPGEPAIENKGKKQTDTVTTTVQNASFTNAKSETTMAIKVAMGLTFLALIPAILISLTAFLRIVIVLSMLRHAIGMQETPPNMAIIGLALFMTLFTMAPVTQEVNTRAFQPFMQNQISIEEAMEVGMQPLRQFMVAQTREADIALMVELSHAPEPKSIEDVSNVQLIPAFMLSELRAAFQIGFLIFLPFLLIDLIVSSILMGLGMMMMPPTAIALPLKILMFVLVDGWSLVMRALVGSFH